jgi:dynein heavy chain
MAHPHALLQVTDMSKLQRLVEEYLDDYNGGSPKPMRLVMFLDAIEHVSRICRVIRLPQGGPPGCFCSLLALADRQFDLLRAAWQCNHSFLRPLLMTSAGAPRPAGNALLLGVGGSGRQSLTRLAAFMQGFDVYSIGAPALLSC